MPRAGYRSGEKRVDVWLSVAQKAHVQRMSKVWDCSMSDVVVRLIREEVQRHGESGAGPGPRLAVVADQRGSRDSSGRGGEDPSGVDAGVVVDEVTGRVWHPAAVPAYPDAVGDPFGDDDPFASVL